MVSAKASSSLETTTMKFVVVISSVLRDSKFYSNSSIYYVNLAIVFCKLESG